MSVNVNYIFPETPANWNWPVQIGFLNELTTAKTFSELDENYRWLRELAHVYTISRIRSKSNILVLNGSINDIYQSLSNYSFSISTDLLVLFLEPGSNLPIFYEQTIERLQNITYNSFFITVTPTGKNPLFWLAKLIYHLSHNLAIDQGIESIGWPGHLVTTREFAKESKIENVLEKTLGKVKSASEKKDYDFSKTIREYIIERIHDNNYVIDPPNDGNTTRGIDSTGKDDTISKGASPLDRMINEVKEKKDYFRYNRESEEATLLKKIEVEHSSNISNIIEDSDSFGGELTKKTGARYLQCVFYDDNKKTTHHALLTNKPYSLAVKIDTLDEKFIQGGEVTSEDVRVEVGKKERVDILLRYGGDTLSQKSIELSSHGPSTVAIFDITVAKTGETVFDIFAFHKNRLFQQIGLSVFLCEKEGDFGNVPGMKIEMINMPRTTLTDFELKEKYGLSLVFNDGLPVIAQESSIEQITDEDHINKFNEDITAIIEEYVTTNEITGEQLIVILAELGSELFMNLFDEIDDVEVFDKPIQIISSSSKHFPLEFAYTKEFHPNAERLCPKATEALENGSCANCNEGNEKYVCPFGFAALRTVIERHRIGENVDQIDTNHIGLKTDVTMIRPAIPILANTLFGTSERVDKSKSGLRAQVGQKIIECSAKATEVNNWDNWREYIKNQKPDSLIIIGHVEPPRIAGSKLLEIGGDKRKKAALNNEYVVAKDESTKPFMIIIGCNIQDVELSFTDFASHFKRRGAAIVLSTFTKIRGSHAVPLVEQLLDILHSKKGNTDLRFGEVMLELRRKLFAKGLYVSMALVSHGDADWKLKI